MSVVCLPACISLMDSHEPLEAIAGQWGSSISRHVLLCPTLPFNHQQTHSTCDDLSLQTCNMCCSLQGQVKQHAHQQQSGGALPDKAAEQLQQGKPDEPGGSNPSWQMGSGTARVSRPCWWACLQAAHRSAGHRDRVPSSDAHVCCWGRCPCLSASCDC